MPSVSSIRKWMFLVLLAAAIGCNEKASQPDAKKGPHPETPEEGTNIQAFLSETGMDMGQLEARVKGKLRSPYMLHYQRTDSRILNSREPYTSIFTRTRSTRIRSRLSKASSMRDTESIYPTRTKFF
jgi:hypothetical protein